MGFSPDHRTLAVVSIGSNSVTFIDTATNAVKHITYVGRSPHEAFFTPDGKEVWVTVRGENYVAVLDGTTYEEKTRIIVAERSGHADLLAGRQVRLCLLVVQSGDRRRSPSPTTRSSAGCRRRARSVPNIAATPDGTQVWFTLKDIGKTQVFDARPPFAVLKTLDTGPITNHVNIVRNAHGQFAYVTVGGLNEVKVFRTDDFSKVATIPVGKLPHGIWPSGDGTRVYVGLENDDGLAAIDTLTNKVIATVPIGQAPQALVYVPNAVPEGDGHGAGLQPLGVAGQAAHLTLAPPAGDRRQPAQAADQRHAVRPGADPGAGGRRSPGSSRSSPTCWRWRTRADGAGAVEPLASFMTNPAGAAIVNAVGPIRQIVRARRDAPRRYLVIVAGAPAKPGAPVQVQAE